VNEKSFGSSFCVARFLFFSQPIQTITSRYLFFTSKSFVELICKEGFPKARLTRRPEIGTYNFNGCFFSTSIWGSVTVTERESDSGELAKLEKLKMVLLLPHLLKNVSRLTLAFKSMQKVTQLLARNDFGLEDNWKLKSCSHVVYWHRKLGSFGYVMLLRYKLHFTRKNIKKMILFRVLCET